MISPLLSRSLLLRLESLTDDDVAAVLAQALADERGLAGGFALDDDALDHLVRLAGGDARRSLTYLEAAAGAARRKGLATIDLATAETAVDRAAVRYDRQGDQHYDVISAFIKSVRGSDADAALHYLARMIEAGEDPRFIARRLVILASEDIGLADPTALHDRGRRCPGRAADRHARGAAQPRPGHHRARRGAQVQRGDHGHRRRERRRPRRQDRTGAAAPARRPLRRGEEARATAPGRDVLQVQPRRAVRHRRAAVRPGRGRWTPSTTGRPSSAPRPRSSSAGSGSAR